MKTISLGLVFSACLFTLVTGFHATAAAKAAKSKAPTKPTKPTKKEEPDLEIAPADFKLIEFFSVDKTPGKGTLNISEGKSSEPIEFGEKGGHFGIGVVFRSTQLPEPYDKDFNNNDILQIALGTLKNRIQGQVPQFATATLLTDKPIRTKTTFKLRVPTGKEAVLKNTALLLLTSPNTPSEQSDEEKLKGTFFAPTGTIVVSPKGKLEMVRIKSQGKKYNFAMQMMALDISATLSTPFNAQEFTLKGKIEIPVYAPYGRGAIDLAKRIAEDSFGGMGPIPTHEGLSAHKRDVAGSTKKDARPAPDPGRGTDGGGGQ